MTTSVGLFSVDCSQKVAPSCPKDIGLVIQSRADIPVVLERAGWRKWNKRPICPACLAYRESLRTVLGLPLAYAGHRAVLRKSTTDAIMHVVMELTVATGLDLPDSECGELGYIPMGDWDPSYKYNCRKCTAVLAGALLPEVAPERAVPLPEPVAAPTPLPLTRVPLPWRRSRTPGPNQLDLLAG